MSFEPTGRFGLFPIFRFLRRAPAQVRKILSWRNWRTLLRALREEPPDLILENFMRLWRRKPGQFGYDDRFLAVSAYLKVYFVQLRRESGMLKIVIWVMARTGIDRIDLLAGEARLPVRPDRFFKPDLAGLFAEFADHEQGGYIFQHAFDGPLIELGLEVTDRERQKAHIPIGTYFQERCSVEPGVTSLLGPSSDRLTVLLHDWALNQLPNAQDLLHSLEIIRSYQMDLVICCRELPPGLLPQQWPMVPMDQLSEILEGILTDYVLLLSIDTQWPEHFFSALLSDLARTDGPDIMYFDEQSIGHGSSPHSPVYKPAYSPEYLATTHYIGPNYCLRSKMGRRLDWFTAADFQSGGYHLLLRASAITDRFERMIGLWLDRPESDRAVSNRQTAAEEQVRVQYFGPQGWTVNPGLVPGSSEVLRTLDGNPLVTIIIPFRDQVDLLQCCLRSIFEKTRYTAYEILLVSNNSCEKETFDYLDTVCLAHAHCRWERFDEPFNYARINNWAARQARGDFLLLLNNDMEVITSGWIGKMLSYSTADEVGAVGAKLLYPDKTTQHAGIIAGVGGIAVHAHKHYPDHFGGYDGRANKVQNVTACTAACLLLRRSVFEQVGGFDEIHFPVAFNDVDLCLKIHLAGYRIVYTPFVKLFHYESISRGAENTPAKRRRARREIRAFRKKWRRLINEGDPYYHPAFSRRRDFGRDE